MRTVGLAKSAFIGLSNSSCDCESRVSLSVTTEVESLIFNLQFKTFGTINFRYGYLQYL